MARGVESPRTNSHISRRISGLYTPGNVTTEVPAPFTTEIPNVENVLNTSSLDRQCLSGLYTDQTITESLHRPQQPVVNDIFVLPSLNPLKRPSGLETTRNVTSLVPNPPEPEIKVLVPNHEIQEGIARIAPEINRFFGPDYYTVVTVEKGGSKFREDVVPHLTGHFNETSLRIKSYKEGTQERTQAEVLVAPTKDEIEDMPLLIVEDLIDTGWGMVETLRYLETLNPGRLLVVTAFDKWQSRDPAAQRILKEYEESNKATFISMKKIEGKWVFQYGMDDGVTPGDSSREGEDVVFRSFDHLKAA